MKSKEEVPRGLAYWQRYLDALDWARTYSDKPAEMDTKYLEVESSVHTMQWVLKEESATGEVMPGHADREEVL